MSSPRALVLTALFITTLSSPITLSNESSELTPSCTIDHFTMAPIQTDCTFPLTTLLHTALVDCHGCAMRTKRIGAGLASTIIPCSTRIAMLDTAICSIWTGANERLQPCRKVTTVPGTAQKTVTGCLPSVRMWGEIPDDYYTAAKATSMLPFSARSQIIPASWSEFGGLWHDEPGTATVTAYEEKTVTVVGCRETGLVKRVEKEEE